MGNFFSAIGQIVVSAFHELIITIVDIVVFITILFLLTIAAYLLAIVVRIVFKLVFTSCRPKVAADWHPL